MVAILEIDRVFGLPELSLTALIHDGSIDLGMILAEVGIDLELRLCRPSHRDMRSPLSGS